MTRYDPLENFYEILGLHPKAPREVIDAAYKARIIKAHPDRGGSNDLAAKLNNAHAILIDTNERVKYDEFLRGNKKTIGNYRVLEKIGEGAFGRTYKGEHVILKELACLKQNINISLEDTEALVKEAKVLWNIHHYSLPTLRDFFKEPDGSCVIAMTYIDGKRLDKIVEAHGGLEPEHASWITQRLLNAMHYLHFNGVIHCDIKPQNIIIKPEEHNAVLVDYGFACLRPGRKTAPEGYTPAYAAPEMLAGRPPLPESDLYSLGATMIFALGGNPIAKTYPKGVPAGLQDYFNELVLHDYRQRPNWEKEDLVKKLSDLREKIFGKRQSNKKLNV